MPFDPRVRILLVEDDPEDHLITRALLHDIEGWEPRLDWASTYEDGLRKVAEAHYDVALVDYRLGARTGVEFIGEEATRAGGTPVIILTGQGGREVDLEATRAGAADYLHKGELTSEGLERTIRYAVESRRRIRVEARFRALIDNGRDLITVMDADGTARYISPSLVRVLGFDPEEMVGVDLLEEVHPNDRPRVRRVFRALLEEPGQPREVRYRVRHRDGSWRTLDTVAQNLLEDPLIEGIVVNSWDVTALYETQVELRRREADLQERVKELGCLYGVQRALHGTGPGWTATLQEVVDLIPPAFHFPERMAARLRLEGRTFLSSGFRESRWRLDAPVEVGGVEVGNVRVCFVRPPPEDLDEAFLPEERLLVEAVADRVGEALARRRAEQELEASERFHRTLLERSGLVVAVVGRGGEVVHVSGEVETLLGREPDDLVGREIAEILSPRAPDRVRSLLEQATGNPGTILEGEGEVEGPGGEGRTVEYGVRSLLDDEVVGGVVVTARDVTERVRQERRIRFQAELLDRVGQPVLATDEAGRVTYWNRAAEGLLGWSAEEMVGADFVDRVVPPEVAERAAAIRERVAGGEPWEGELPLLRKDGGRVVVQGTVTVSRGPDGTPAGRIAAGADITDLRRAERELEQQTEFLEAVISGAPVILFAVDPAGRITLSEGRGLEALGLEAGELEGVSVFDLYADDSVVLESVRRALDGESFRNVLHTRSRWLETRWSPLPGGRGAIGVSVDITERREAEGEQRRLLDLVDATPDFVGIADLDGHVLFLNRSARRMAGLGEEESLGGLTVADLHPPEVMEMIREEAVPTAVRDGSWSGETTVLGPDGGKIPVWQVVVAHGARGEVEFLSTVARDITERNRAARRIRFQAGLLDAVGQAVVAADLERRITHWNRAAEEMFGWSREEVLGRDLGAVIPSDRSREEAREVMGLLETGETWTGEIEFTRRDGTTFPALVTDAPITDGEGRMIGMVGISQDLTERKALEEELRQAQKMEAIGRLAGGVAHDFNNLLTAIHGHAELLLQDLESASPLRDEVHHIRAAGERAADLTRQLLAFSRKQRLEPRTLDLRHVARDMEPMLRRLIPESVELRFDTGEEPILVEADPSQIQQVILNLAVNAGDAMGEHGVLSLEVDETRMTEEEADDLPWEAEPGPYARLTVSDTGVGMGPDVLAHLFEPFFTTKSEGKGTGLGLSTVFGIVKQSGGHIFVDSEPGEGTTFRILLPRVEGAVDEVPGREEAVTPAERGRETVLLVEDDASVRRLARRVLERTGYEVIESRNGREALEAADRLGSRIHLVVSDVVMPEMGGARLVDLLREHHPRLRVVLTSGYSEEEFGGGVSGRGAAFLGKPFTPDELIRVVQEVLSA